jgi:hypothetical protein
MGQLVTTTAARTKRPAHLAWSMLIILMVPLGVATALLGHALFGMRSPAGADGYTGIKGLTASSLTIDLGVVASQESATRGIVLQNTGSTPLQITDVTPDCSCTHASVENTYLPSGSATRLVVTYNATPGSSGWIHRRVVVRAKCGDVTSAAVFDVVGKVTIFQPLFAFPSECTFAPALAGSTVQQTVFLRGTRSVLSAVPDVITVIAGRDQVIDVPPPDLTSETFEEHPVMVRLQIPSRYQPGTASSTLTFHCSKQPSLPDTSVSFVDSVVPPISLRPSALFLICDKQSGSAQGTVRVCQNGGQPITVLGIDGGAAFDSAIAADKTGFTIRAARNLTQPISRAVLDVRVLIGGKEAQIPLPVVVINAIKGAS